MLMTQWADKAMTMQIRFPNTHWLCAAIAAAENRHD
jgi:hypothetical protein